jgi:hypothetical protein
MFDYSRTITTTEKATTTTQTAMVMEKMALQLRE